MKFYSETCHPVRAKTSEEAAAIFANRIIRRRISWRMRAAYIRLNAVYPTQGSAEYTAFCKDGSSITFFVTRAK